MGHSLSRGRDVPCDIEPSGTDSQGSAEPESVARCWEVEAIEPDVELGPTSVKGRLRSCLQFWESELEAPASVKYNQDGIRLAPQIRAYPILQAEPSLS